ncbi:MAG: response regulator [Bryobacterales bacterium]|nr:response regulator [Bryobacterales bacterium]MBV9396934.1 response regulator [Bryobacterales bacterium]
MKRSLILNVDDNDLNRYVRTKFLQQADFDLLEASTGAQTLQLAYRDQPDLVLLDVHLPDAHAAEVCRILKTDPRTKGMMVLQISASATAVTDAVNALEGGADGYLIEPVEPALLLAHVRSLLRLRESEMQLRRANDSLKQFAYMASHDLQEPLRAVMIYTELLEKELNIETSDSLQHHLSAIHDGASRLEALLADLLTYSRASESGAGVPAKVSLETCLRAAIAACEIGIQEANATVTHDTLPVVEGDQTGLTQVFQNLISNALKYRKPGCPVHIHVAFERTPREVVISVRDNGQGFNPEYSDHIFGLFKRLHGRSVPGSGIGLAVCRAIVERNGGRMWAEGKEGVGATFHIALPAPAQS